jgi:site-specific recombinase
VATVNGVEVYRRMDADAGRSEEELKAALALESKRALLAALQASDLPDQIAAVLNSVSALGGTEEEIDKILGVAVQVKNLTDVIEQMADPVAAADEALENASRTLYDTFIDARQGLLDLQEGFDGSTESLDDLVAASADYAKAQLALVIQIRQLKGEIEGMFEDTATRIREQVMSEDQLYVELQRQADAAFEAMMLATDPEEVARYAAEINRLIERSFGLLSPEEQQAAAADYLANIERVNTAFQDKLDAMTDVLVEAGESDREFIQTALDEIVAKMTGAGETFESGAATIAAAASRGIAVDISVSDRRVDYEVNG